ncbi:GatB/YqeY domain-containing protein [Candidatus Woesebacteria bacterium]|nr:GatB/YqeY domain-containing protein [Candidatus Woesebacteria bacterium]
MAFKQQLMEDMKNAMRAHDSTKLNCIRFLLSDLKNLEIDKGEQTDAQIQDLVRKQVKQMEETNLQYQQGGRLDLVQENEAKVAVLRAYLPPEMSEAELASVVTELIAQNPGQGIGPLIGLVRQKTEGRVDGGAIATEVKRQLGV